VDDILGPGGARTASYSIYLAGIYRDAWIAPAKSSGRRAVRVKVTISKDGTVLSREVLDKSGDRDFVRAAENTVNRVKKFDRPPPTNESSVTYTLEFIPPN
jgi:TonB family protein